MSQKSLYRNLESACLRQDADAVQKTLVALADRRAGIPQDRAQCSALAHEMWARAIDPDGRAIVDPEAFERAQVLFRFVSGLES